MRTRLRTTTGKGFMIGDWKKSCRKLKIRAHHSVPYEPEGNGKVERLGRTLLDATRAICWGVDKRLWGRGISCASYVRNRLPTKKGTSPYHSRFGKAANISHLRTFGLDNGSYLCGAWTEEKPEKFLVYEAYSVKFKEDQLVANIDLLKDPEKEMPTGISPFGGEEINTLSADDLPKRGRPRKDTGGPTGGAGGGVSGPISNPSTSSGVGSGKQQAKKALETKKRKRASDDDATTSSKKRKTAAPKQGNTAKQQKEPTVPSVPDDSSKKTTTGGANTKKKGGSKAAKKVAKSGVKPKAAATPQKKEASDAAAGKKKGVNSSVRKKSVRFRGEPEPLVAPGFSKMSIPTPKQAAGAHKRTAAELFDEIALAEENPGKRQKSSADLIFEAIEDEATALFVAEVLHGDARNTPKKLREGPEAEQWRAADKAERDALESMGCWRIVDYKDIPAGANIIPSCALYNRKRSGRFQCRLVAR
eukprot:gene499-biopygen112